MKKVMCIAVHPDDETLGCGGTLFRHKAEGDELAWTIMTEMTIELGFSQQAIDTRQNEIDAVTASYGFSQVSCLGFPTTKMDQIPQREVIHSLVRAIEAFSPEVLYVPFYGDAHSDHRVTFEAIKACLKSFRFPNIKRALMMETLSETEYAFPQCNNTFAPNYFVDVSGTIDQKILTMKMFASEFAESPVPRSERLITSLANFRGSYIGKDHAEAF